MNAALQDLLNRMREHPAFPELLKTIDDPSIKTFKPSGDAAAQTSEWIFRSGRSFQHDAWKQFLTEGEQEKA